MYRWSLAAPSAKDSRPLAGARDSLTTLEDRKEDWVRWEGEMTSVPRRPPWPVVLVPCDFSVSLRDQS